MKKGFLLVFATISILILSACFNYRDIERNFEDAGYTYSEDSTYIVSQLLTEFEEDGIEVTMYAFNRETQVAVVIEFNNEEDMNESLDNNMILKSLLSKFDHEEVMRKNYIVIPIAMTDEGEQQIIDTFHE